MSKEFPQKIERDLPPYLRKVSEKYDTDADDCVQSHLAAMEAVPPPPSLFHYSTAEGLAGILKSGCLWLSDIFTLNDPSELVFALEVAGRLAKSHANTEEMQILSDQLDHFTSLDAARAVASYYVCSFSGNGDDLGQWRSCADNARGFALEFDTASLEAIFTKSDGEPIANNSTFPVEYDENKLEKVVDQLLQLLVQKIAFVRRVMPNNAIAYGAYMSSLLLTTALNFFRLSLFFKHFAYLHEGEYRFLALYGVNGPPSDLKRRVRGETKIDYLELSWRSLAPSALKSIRVGPAADFDGAKRFAKQALESSGLGDLPIMRSSIPYRA